MLPVNQTSSVETVRFLKARGTPAGLRRRYAIVLVAVVAAILLGAAAIVPASAAEDENYKIAEGLGVYLGVMPAGIVKGHPEGHPEATMHGGVPTGRHEYHLIIAVFDVATGARVENARVSAAISGLGHIGENSLELEPMQIAGTVTYGGFVDLPGTDRYDIKVDVSVPGRPAARVDFTYQHLAQ